MTDLLSFENELYTEKAGVICGVDEAGRGPLAGPVYAAAVILPKGFCPEGLNDSKKVSPKKREMLYDIIIKNAKAWCVATASVQEIDELNILRATYLAMNRALEGVGKTNFDLALIDGNRNEGINYKSLCVIGGDGKCASIAAASILAKVSRDCYMHELAEQYPQYEFDKHKGYGTKLHYERLREYGVSPVHRRSFLKNIV